VLVELGFGETPAVRKYYDRGSSYNYLDMTQVRSSDEMDDRGDIGMPLLSSRKEAGRWVVG